jgi:hypothetical protein
MKMKICILFLFCISKSFSFGFQQLDDKNIYVKNQFFGFERFSSRFPPSVCNAWVNCAWPYVEYVGYEEGGGGVAAIGSVI